MPIYLYTLLYRPPAVVSLPRIPWALLERPKLTPNNFERRTDLPVSEHQFGVVAFEQKLTDREVESYQLKYLGTKEV